MSAPHVLFLLVGEGAEKEQLVSLVRSRGLTNLRFVDQQSRERIPAYICASDACVVLLKKTEIFKTVIPSKMLEFMSCARPVILGVEGPGAQDSGGGPGRNLHRAGKSIATGGGGFASGRGRATARKRWVAMDAAMCCSTFRGAKPRLHISRC